MSQEPEQKHGERQQRAEHHEEAALPVASTARAAADVPLTDFQLKRRTTIRVVGTTVIISILMSVALEYGGWQRAFVDMPTPHAPIPPLSFLRGVWDTTLGAVGIGAGLALGTLLAPSTWRTRWRRVPAAFALGAAAFLAFLSFVTFDFMR